MLMLIPNKLGPNDAIFLFIKGGPSAASSNVSPATKMMAVGDTLELVLHTGVVRCLYTLIHLYISLYSSISKILAASKFPKGI